MTLSLPEGRTSDYPSLLARARERARREFPNAAEEVAEMYRAARAYRAWANRCDDHDRLRIARAVGAVDRVRSAA